MTKRILFIDKGQFGTLTDTLKYCQYLSKDYYIDYICFDQKHPYINIPNVNVIYVPFTGPKVFRGLRLILKSIVRCVSFKGFIFIVYFPKCDLIKRFVFWKRMHLDIRTLSVEPDEAVREYENKKINSAIRLFDSVSFISEGIKQQLEEVKNKPTYILPLGSDVISNVSKDFNNLRLLYVGTLFNRNILQTVIGVHLFRKEYPDIPITYDIIGSGKGAEEIERYISDNHLDDVVCLHGRISHDQLTPFFDRCNIGVSYVPIVDYYNFQPPTKTFEYVLSGLYCIATNTFANREVVFDDNGILINDTPIDFKDALYKVYQKRLLLDSDKIRKTVINFLWSNLINKYLCPILDK